MTVAEREDVLRIRMQWAKQDAQEVRTGIAQ
jgi:hypothetical protein